MGIIFVVAAIVVVKAEYVGNPFLAELHATSSANMEGKRVVLGLSAPLCLPSSPPQPLVERLTPCMTPLLQWVEWCRCG